MGFLENIQEKTQYFKEKLKTKKNTQGFGKVENAVCRKRVQKRPVLFTHGQGTSPCPKSTYVCFSFSGVISVVSPVGERRASGLNSGKVVQAVRRSGH